MVHFLLEECPSVRRSVRRCESEISQKIDSSGAFEAIMHQTTPMNSSAIQRQRDREEKTKQWRPNEFSIDCLFDHLFFVLFRIRSETKLSLFRAALKNRDETDKARFFCTSSSRLIVGSKKESQSRARAQTRAKARRSLLTSFELVSKFIFGKFIGCLFFSWMIFFLCRNLVVRFLFIVFLIWMTIKHLS